MEVRFSPPNLKKIGYPKNMIYMKLTKEQSIKEVDKEFASGKHDFLWQAKRQVAQRFNINESTLDNWYYNKPKKKKELSKEEKELLDNYIKRELARILADVFYNSLKGGKNNEQRNR
jgi:hypothetical protein